MPDEEKALNRLGIDGFSLVRAGTETMGSSKTYIQTLRLWLILTADSIVLDHLSSPFQTRDTQ